MENFTILDTETSVVSGNELKGKDVENNAPRKGLSDITNLRQQPIVLTQGAKLLLQPASLRSKDYIDKLQHENMTLMKVLADQNKVVELSGIELQKLRINLEKFQQQNLLLAQANSQMLAELNSGKDRLKALKHELGCKNAVLKAIKSEVGTNKCGKAGESLKKEDKEDRPCDTNRCDKASESLKEEDGEKKPCNTNRRRQSKSLCLSNIKPVQAEEGVNNKRVCLRRQSARLKAQEPDMTKDVFEADNTKFLVSSSCDDKVHESGPITSGSSVKREHDEGCITTRNESQEIRRVSVGRPLRRAAEKVQSYKEMKLNAKMRREE